MNFFKLTLITILIGTAVCTQAQRIERIKRKTNKVIRTGSDYHARIYRHSIGIRGVRTTGLSYKYFTKRPIAFELVGGFFSNAFTAAFLAQRYTPSLAFAVENLNWYYGLGLEITTPSDVFERDTNYTRKSEEIGAGPAGVLGLEYNMKYSGLAIAIEVKPFYDISSEGEKQFFLDSGARISLRF